MRYLRGLKITCAYIAIYHLLLGVMAIFASQSFAETLIRVFYGTSLTVDGTLFYIVKFIAAYFIAFGGMMGMIAFRPLQYRYFVWVGVVFFAVRLFELFYFKNFIAAQFQVADNRIVAKIAVIVILMAALIFFSLKAESPVPAESFRKKS